VANQGLSATGVKKEKEVPRTVHVLEMKEVYYASSAQPLSKTGTQLSEALKPMLSVHSLRNNF